MDLLLPLLPISAHLFLPAEHGQDSNLCTRRGLDHTVPR